ncbi:MAG: phage tail assembly chaperone [Thiopseudomonas sp.]|nr:phage tail assembly chaperone [Thiopseudomonas sp.]
MRYYRDNSGSVYAISPIQTHEKEWVALTKKETEELLNPQPTNEQLAATARAERDRLIESVRWRIERHNDELALGSEPTEPLEPLLQYTQELRDIPQQEGFPTDIIWPEGI